MEKETKIKIIIFSVIGLLVLVFIFILLSFFSKGKEKEEQMNLTVQENSDFTLDDMMKVNDNKQYASNQEQSSILSTRNQRDYDFEGGEGVYQTEDEDIQRLQKALKEDNKTQSRPVERSVNSTVPSKTKTVAAYTPEPKLKDNPKEVQPKSEPTEQPKETPKTEAKKTNRFYRASEEKITGNTVSAVVHGEQTITNRGTLKMRLLEDLYTMDGTLIPKDTYVYGVANITQERIIIGIESVRIGKNIYALNRQVFDQDGLKGINVPENLKAEIAKKSSAQALQNADVQTGGGDILSRTANTVTSTAKNLLSKDAQEIKVTIKSNYKIYLK